MRIERISGAILILLSGVLLLMAAYAGAVGVHPADHHGKVRLQFRLRQVRLRQVRRRRGEQSEGRLQKLPEQRTG